CGDGTGPSGPGPAASLTIISGNNIDGPVGTTVGTPLAVRVVDANSRPVPNVLVQFSIPLGGGSLSAAADTSDAEGLASVTWTLGQTAGNARAEARAQGVTPAQFNAIVRAGAPAALQRVSNPPGTSAANFELADSVSVRLTDNFGNPIEGVAVGFSVTAGGGTISHTTRTTSVQGTARVAWRLGAAGAQALRAAAGAIEATVDATAAACTETTIAPGSVLTIGAVDPRCVILSAPAARYFISVVNAAPNAGSTNAFRLRGAGEASAPSTTSIVSTPAPTLGLRSAAARAQIEEARTSIAAHDALMRANERVIQQLAPYARTARAAMRMNTMAAMVPPNLGDTLNLRIPANFSSLCSLTSATAVRARVVFVGEHGVMLEDVASPLVNQIDTLYQRVGQEFDTRMWQLLNDNFGNPLAMDAQLDNNQRFFMLFSPVVNNLQGGGIAGFVSSSDFFPTSVCAASNLAEIFYARVPTVEGPGFGAGTIGDWNRRAPTVMMHEVKHIVSFAERLSRGQVPSGAFNDADRWLEESSAMLAEELWGRSVFGYQPESNVTYLQSIHCEVRLNEVNFPECPQPYKPLNIFDHFILLYDFLSNPEGLSPIGASATGDFSFYGSGWSFLRWVVDNYAATEGGFLTALTQEITLPGLQNIEARTGRTFAELVNEWAVAQIMDDYPNFSAANTRHKLDSWNSRDIFAGMNRDFSTQGFFLRAFPLVPRAAAFGNFVFDVTAVRGGSMSVFEVTGTQAARQLFEVSGLAGTNFPADMRVNIIRVE
ncbi:MAG TPA: Ig-like domain-containing protein, partial [Longimicrobiales bacterium]|nr:Ig-like domain-containing protein [Longimicrobiales bacterium]